MLKRWTKARIKMMGFEMRTDKRKLIDLIKQMPDDINVLIRSSEDKNIYDGIAYVAELDEKNVYILINPSND